MIKINVGYHGTSIRYLKVEGHANYDEYGKDIVCAGVSSIVTGALNNLDVKNFKIQMNDGLVEIEVKGELTTHDEVVLETILVQLQTMAESYPKFIKIIK